MDTDSRKTFVEIDLKNLKSNFEFIKDKCGNKKIASVVKANAYGHGLLQVSRFLEEVGTDYLCVAIADEGAYIRENGINIPILVLGALNETGYKKAIDNKLDITIGSIYELKTLLSLSGRYNYKTNIQLLIDTGMHRDGFCMLDEFKSALDLIKMSDLVNIKGIYTHFAQADSDKLDFAHFQLEEFKKYLKFIDITDDLLIHCSASAGVMNSIDSNGFNMVRPGLLLYGYSPLKNSDIGLKKVMSLKAEIISKRVVKAGESIGYSRSYYAENDICVATAAIGYGDGLPRALSNKGKVIINDKLCSIIGNVCMDQIMVDVTGINDVNVGDTCTIIGNSATVSIDAGDIAKLTDTISYEILCSFNERVSRVYEH